MSFIQKIRGSIYNPVFYSEALLGSLGSAFKYFFGFILLVTFIATIVISVVFVPKAIKFFDSVGSQIITNYPENLEVRIEKGVASSNVAEPYMIEIPEGLRHDMKDVESIDEYANIIVIDTTHEFSMSKFLEYKTAALLTRDSLVSIDSQGKITMTPLKNMPDMTINHSNVVTWVNRISPIAERLPYAIPVFVFIGLFIMYTFSLVYLLVAALLVFLVEKIRGGCLSYKQSYKLSLYAITLPIILSCVAMALGVKMIAFVPTAVLLLVILVNVKSPTQPVQTPVV